MLLAWQTALDVASAVAWQENPLGLFLASDGALALAFGIAGVHNGRGFALEALTVVLGLAAVRAGLSHVAWPESGERATVPPRRIRGGPNARRRDVLRLYAIEAARRRLPAARRSVGCGAVGDAAPALSHRQ